VRGRRGEREDFCAAGHLIRMRPGLLNIKAPAVLTLLCVCARVFRGESHLSGHAMLRWVVFANEAAKFSSPCNWYIEWYM